MLFSLFRLVWNIPITTLFQNVHSDCICNLFNTVPNFLLQYRSSQDVNGAFSMDDGKLFFSLSSFFFFCLISSFSGETTTSTIGTQALCQTPQFCPIFYGKSNDHNYFEILPKISFVIKINP